MGPKVSESAKAMSLAFVLLDFEHAGIRRRAKRVARASEYRHGLNSLDCETPWIVWSTSVYVTRTVLRRQ